MRLSSFIRAGTFRVTLLGALLGAGLATAQAGVERAEPGGPLALAAPIELAKQPGEVYIVQLNEPGAASYKGGIAGFAATKPRTGAKLDATSGSVSSYVKYLEDSHDRLLGAIGAGGSKIYSFRYALNGFATRLTPAELTRLARRPEVRHIWRDSVHELATNNSAQFLGLLDQNGGLRADLGLEGEDIVIGVVDSGIAPTHPALRDYEERIPRACRSQWATASWLGLFLCRSVRRNPPRAQVYDPPEDFRGICQTGDGFPEGSCNNKLIGARYYADGFLFQYELDPAEFLSPMDADGHGTHIATTAAGNRVTASLFGTRVGEIAGIAPRARLAVYKACWVKPGETRASCATSDLARAIDDAVADGVDIINYSVGSLETDLTAPEDIALLNAVDAGVLSVVAGGNDGPANYTIGSPSSAPWVLTVAASTQNGTRYEPAVEITAPPALAGKIDMREAEFTPRLAETGAREGALVLTDDGQNVLVGGGLGSPYDGCESLRNGSDLSGRIALLARGGCNFDDKIARVEAAGAIAAVVYNTSGDPIAMEGAAGSVRVPAVMIGMADGQRLVDALLAGDAVEVRLEYGLLAEHRDTGNEMAYFSSRGPSLSEEAFIKPDVTAPGVNILAGSSPSRANATQGEYFRYLSGTSAAAPEVAGLAALLKQANPDWSAGALKSALMTTAYTDVVTEDLEFFANPFDMGSGHVDANAAITPGLVYDTGFRDYAAYLCGLEEPFSVGEDCNALAAAGLSFEPEQLNLPSIGIAELIPGDVIRRRVTNLGPPASYTATLTPPPGVTAAVQPTTLSLGTGESAEFSLALDTIDPDFEFWNFGDLTWSDGTHTVAAPIASRPVYIRSPRELRIAGVSGTGSMPVDFGYTDTYEAVVHGLHEPGLREAGTVEDDVTRQFSFRFASGVTAHYFTLGPGELFLRVALFDEYTDGEDDLDLYLYHCPTLATCTQVGQSGSFTSDEHIDLIQPPAGFYTVLVHGFKTDETRGGTGSNYEVFAWSFASDDDSGNFGITAPTTVAAGDRLDLPYTWQGLDPTVPYLGAVSHNTPYDLFFLTIVTANTP